MPTTPQKNPLSGEAIAAALIALGVDPDATRIVALQRRIDADALPPGDRESVIRTAVDAANRGFDASPDGAGTVPANKIVVGARNVRGGTNHPGKPVREGQLGVFASPYSQSSLLVDVSEHDRHGALRWTALTPDDPRYERAIADAVQREAKDGDGAAPEQAKVPEHVIFSRSEGDDLDGDVGAFWSNDTGWGSFEAATRFTSVERMKRGSGILLPISCDYDAQWLSVPEAMTLRAANTDPAVIEARVLAEYESMLGKTVLVGVVSGYRGNDSVDIQLDPPAKVRIAKTTEASLKHWNDDWCDPYWEVELVEPHPQLEGIRSTWISGSCYHLNGQQTDASDVISVVNVEPNHEPASPSPGM